MLVVNLCYEQEKKKTKGAYLFGLAGGDDKSGRDEKEQQANGKGAQVTG